MKKWKLLFLTTTLSMFLVACGKSEAVKNVETMITGLGEITLESNDNIKSAEEAYAALAEEEKSKVENYAELISAKTTYAELKDTYYEEILVGEWMKNSDIMVNSIIEGNQTTHLSLNSDKSSLRVGEDKGTWSIEDGYLINTMEDNKSAKYEVIEEDGIIKLQGSTLCLVTLEEYENYLNKIFKIVELSEENINEYCDFYLFEEHTLDDFGERTGDVWTNVMLRNKLFEDGWYYFDGEDIAIEVNFPNHTRTTMLDGYEYVHEIESHVETMTRNNPFNSDVDSIGRSTPSTDGAVVTTDISIDQLSFGRVKGKLCFINKDYVKEVVQDEGSRNLVFVDGHSFNVDNYRVGTWVDGIDY